MKKKSQKLKFPSELRLDLVSQDWVVIATGRAKKPETFKKEKRVSEDVSKESCPFCKINTQERPTLIFSQGENIPFGAKAKIPKGWTVIVIPNKYPAFLPYPKLNEIGRAHV